MPTSTLDVTPEILTSICKSTQEGDDAKRFRVVENGLPQDVELVYAALAGDSEHPVIRLYLKSESFTEGEELPPPVLQIVR